MITKPYKDWLSIVSRARALIESAPRGLNTTELAAHFYHGENWAAKLLTRPDLRTGLVYLRDGLRTVWTTEAQAPAMKAIFDAEQAERARVWAKVREERRKLRKAGKPLPPIKVLKAQAQYIVTHARCRSKYKWPEHSSYTPPPPMITSVWELAGTV